MVVMKKAILLWQTKAIILVAAGASKNALAAARTKEGYQTKSFIACVNQFNSVNGLLRKTPAIAVLKGTASVMEPSLRKRT